MTYRVPFQIGRAVAGAPSWRCLAGLAAAAIAVCGLLAPRFRCPPALVAVTPVTAAITPAVTGVQAVWISQEQVQPVALKAGYEEALANRRSRALVHHPDQLLSPVTRDIRPGSR